jgi:hypothetical protein
MTAPQALAPPPSFVAAMAAACPATVELTTAPFNVGPELASDLSNKESCTRVRIPDDATLTVGCRDGSRHAVPLGNSGTPMIIACDPRRAFIIERVSPSQMSSG